MTSFYYFTCLPRREHIKKAEDRESILKNLKDKQKETAAKAPAKDAVEKAEKSKGGEAL